jgi:uncharacterized protein (DUF1330 family)
MPFERLAGLFVSDPQLYAQYRTEIAPLLEAEGGEFRYDLEVARTLKTQSHEINRIFVLRFPDRAAKERFFTTSQYIEIRDRLFHASVLHTTIIAEYNTA